MPEPESVLVNFWYAHPVGHAVEGLRRALGYHAADPTRRIGVVLNAATPVELASLCPFVDGAWGVAVAGYPDGAEPGAVARALAAVPRQWDWVVDDERGHEPMQRTALPWLAAYYDASDAHFVARRGRNVAGVAAGPPSYVPHQQLRFRLPAAERALAARALGSGDAGDGDGVLPPARPARIALMPAGASGPRSWYPSAASWERVIAGLAGRHPRARIVLLGKLGRDDRSRTPLDRPEVHRLLAAVARAGGRPVDGFDRPLVEQLALVEACDVVVSPHTGFGMAALAVATPWLTLSGNRWPEYFYNGVPFHSVLPDLDRFPCWTAFGDAPEPLPADRDGEGPRVPSMCADRVDADLDELLDAADRLVAGALSYEQAMEGHFARLQACLAGRESLMWSIDGVHRDYVSGSFGGRRGEG